MIFLPRFAIFVIAIKNMKELRGIVHAQVKKEKEDFYYRDCREMSKKVFLILLTNWLIK